MRAVVARNRALHVAELPIPEPGSGQVLVKTKHCGICGSDLHALEHGAKMAELSQDGGSALLQATDWTKPVVMGHEFTAEIVEYGPDTQAALAPDTLVCSVPMTLADGQMHAVGYSNAMTGGYGEYMLLSEMLLLPVPAGLSSEQAALTEPMAVGLHAVNNATVQKGDVCLVIGCGSVGLAVIAALKLQGHGPIVAADFSPTRRHLAEVMGADAVFDPSVASAYEHWVQMATPDGYTPGSLEALLGLGPQMSPTVVFECVGVPGMIQQVMAASPRHTRIVVVGVCFEEDRFQPMHGILHELELRFVLGYSPEEFAATLAHIAEGRLEVAPLITGTTGLAGVDDAFRQLAHPNEHAKILVQP